MPSVFVDTFYWLAALNPDDAHHPRAAGLRFEERKVTSLAVLLEVMDALSRPAYRGVGVGFWEAVHTDSRVEIVPLGRPLLDRAVALSAARPDKEWSFTDCISFTVMGEREITDALTRDKHFRQAGFRTLL